MLTVKQFRGISLVVMLLAVLLAIGSVSMARFAKITLSSSSLGVEYRATIGAFHACIEMDVPFTISACGAVSKDCQVTIAGQTIPEPDVPGGELPGWYKDDCSRFNLFRGMHVTATLLVSLSLIVGAVYLVMSPLTSPKWSFGLEITYIVFAAIAAILYIISLIAMDNTISAVPTVALTDYEGNSVLFKAEKYTSFALEGAAVGFLLVSLVLWVAARFVGKQPAASTLEGMPLNDGSSPNGSYSPPALPGQPQQFFNYGAPAPQPNYQYGANPNAPPTNYGFGYQPPPPQTQ